VSEPKPEQESEESPRPRRKWEAPRIRTGQLFETHSLACMKTNAGPEDCLASGEIQC
jgi:hypothetical protein